MITSFRLVQGHSTSEWFDDLESAFNVWANLTPCPADAVIEVQLGNVYWTIQPSDSTYRPPEMLPV